MNRPHRATESGRASLRTSLSPFWDPLPISPPVSLPDSYPACNDNSSCTMVPRLNKNNMMKLDEDEEENRYLYVFF